MSANLDELIKATDSLKTSQRLLNENQLNDPQNIDLFRALRDSCIQRFEFCVELAWKVSIKKLGLSTQAPKPAFREMAQNSLIDNPELWFEFLLARNKSSHSYDEDVAQEVYLYSIKILPELESLITRLQKLS